MIIRIEPSGKSFRGAGRYYLHDKAADKDLPKALKPTTDERVWFTDTRNCANFDPELALDEMWATAEAQQWLKAQAGGRTSGRSCVDPVKTIAIAWHEADAPTPEHMLAAASAYLEAMGWGKHQAVLIGHRDTEHRHIHIILNRVHPETGRTLDDYRDRPRAQKFALAYEKEMGKLWCVEREVKAAARERREPDLEPAQRGKPANQPIPDNVIEATKAFGREFAAAEEQLKAQFAAESAELKEAQKRERLDFFADGKRLFRETRQHIYQELRAEFRGEWAAYFRREAVERERATESVRDALKSAWHFAKAGDLGQAMDSLLDRFLAADDIAAALAAEKADLAKAQKDRLAALQREACDLLLEQRKAEYAAVLARQRGERAHMRAAHAQGRSAEHVVDKTVDPQNDKQTAHEQGGRTPPNDGIGPQPHAAAGERGAPRPETDRPHVQAREDEGPPPHASQRDASAGRFAPQPTLQFELTEGFVLSPEPVPEIQGTEDRRPAPDRSTVLHPTPPVREGAEAGRMRDPADGVATAIGSAASYIADQLGEFIAPTPPEVREAQAQQMAAQTERADKAEERPDPWDYYMREAARQIDEAEARRTRDYWTERDRSKDWERDR